MADLPHPWDLYARLQSSLRHECRMDDRSWGNEAGMTYILNSAAGCPPTQHEVKRVVAATRRRERYRDSRRAPMPRMWPRPIRNAVYTLVESSQPYEAALTTVTGNS